MIVNVPFVYVAEVRRHRKRNRERAYFRSSVDVEVREVPGADAPVAFTHRDDWDNFPRVARWHGNRLWTPLGEGSAKPGAELAADLADTGACRLGPHAGAPARELSAFTAEADPTVAEVHGSDVGEVAMDVRRAVADMMLVDGDAWEASAEPTVKLDWSGDRAWASIRVNRAMGRQVFRLDEAGNAGAGLPGIHLDPGEVERAMGRLGIVVSIPDALRSDTVTPVVLEAGELAVRHMREAIAEADAKSFAIYAMLRDAYELAQRARGGEATTAASALAEAFRDALASHGDRDDRIMPGWLADRLRGAVARADARPGAREELDGFSP